MEGSDPVRTLSKKVEEGQIDLTCSLGDKHLQTDVSKEKKAEKKVPKFTLKQKVALVLMCVADFMSYCCMSIMAPFYPLEAAEKGMTESLAGWVFGYYALVVFISSPIFGAVVPKIGAKCVYISGLMISGVCAILFGTLHFIHDYNTFVTLSFVIRGFEALGASAYTTAGYVIICNVFPDHSGTVRGLLETFVGLGMSAGPGIGGILFALGGFGLPFYVVGAIIVFMSPLNAYLLPTPDSIEVGTKSISFYGLMKLPPILVTCVVITMVSMTWGFLDPTLEPHLRKFELSPSNVGLIFLLLSAMYGIFCPVWGWLTDRLNVYWWLMTTGFFASAVVLLIIGPSPLISVFHIKDSVCSNILCLLALGVFVSMSLMPTYQYLLDNAIAEGFADNIGTNAVIAGIWSAVYSLGEILGPVLGGYLMEEYGFAVTSTVFALLNLAACVFCTFYFMTRKKEPVIVTVLPAIKDEVKPDISCSEISELKVEAFIKKGQLILENVKMK